MLSSLESETSLGTCLLPTQQMKGLSCWSTIPSFSACVTSNSMNFFSLKKLLNFLKHKSLFFFSLPCCEICKGPKLVKKKIVDIELASCKHRLLQYKQGPKRFNDWKHLLLAFVFLLYCYSHANIGGPPLQVGMLFFFFWGNMLFLMFFFVFFLIKGC